MVTRLTVGYNMTKQEILKELYKLQFSDITDNQRKAIHLVIKALEKETDNELSRIDVGNLTVKEKS